MSIVTLVVGESGSGKSSSVHKLDPKKTMIINVLGKELPFKGSAKAYNRENKNLIDLTSDHLTQHTNTAAKRYTYINAVLKDVSENHNHIKTIIIDDVGYLVNLELFEKAKVTGYSKFSEMALNMVDLLRTAKSLREDLNVVFMYHSETIVTDGLTPTKEIKLPGKMIKEKFAPNEICTIVVFTNVTFSPESEVKHEFVVKKTPTFIHAKSPMGMFDSNSIPNDLDLLLSTAREYYSN